VVTIWPELCTTYSSICLHHLHHLKHWLARTLLWGGVDWSGHGHSTFARSCSCDWCRSNNRDLQLASSCIFSSFWRPFFSRNLLYKHQQAISLSQDPWPGAPRLRWGLRLQTPFRGSTCWCPAHIVRSGDTPAANRGSPGKLENGR